MLPVSEGTPIPHAVQAPRTDDPFLQRVLAGEEHLLFDGAMGTMLQRSGLEGGELPELLCLERPEVVTAIHRAYVEAGSIAVTTNTFGANRAKLAGAATVEDVFAAAVACARAAEPQFVAADIGPTGNLLEPMGDMTFDEAYDLFAEQVVAADAAGADLVIIETMASLLEMKAAVLAAKENAALPIFATMTFGENGRTFLGTSPTVAARMLDALGADALGINCSLGPKDLEPLVTEMLRSTAKPVIVQANAGLPSVVNGETIYSISPRDYADAAGGIIEAGATVLGGCCGTDPDYIRELATLLAQHRPQPRAVGDVCAITSDQREAVLGVHDVVVAGGRINAAVNGDLADAFRAGDFDDIVDEAMDQADEDAGVLDVCAGLPELDEPDTLAKMVKQAQEICQLPLQIGSANPRAAESAARVYTGKPLINGVSGTQSSLDGMLPVAAHYGCAVVGLTLDEGGVPPTAEGRAHVAERIVEAAEAHGIPRRDVLIDCLAASASADEAEFREALRAMTLVKEQLGVRTVLGTANVGLGLPAQPPISAEQLTAALEAGLNMPIIDPLDEDLMQVIDI